MHAEDARADETNDTTALPLNPQNRSQVRILAGRHSWR